MPKQYYARVLFSELSINQLKELTKILNVKSKAQVVRSCISLCYFLIKKIQDGEKLILEDKKGNQREAFIPVAK